MMSRRVPPSGAQMITNERARQIMAKGFDAVRDNGYRNNELVFAAACYLWPTPRPEGVVKRWPWPIETFEPALQNEAYAANMNAASRREARIWDLTRAGALIAAEIDRLQRGSDVEEESTTSLTEAQIP